MWFSTRCPNRSATLALVLSIGLGVPALAGAADTQAGEPVSTGTQPNTPVAVHPQLAGSRLCGQATLRFLGFRIYTARLWAAPDCRADQILERPAVLELTYLRDFKASAIAERSVQEMRRSGGFSDAQAQRWQLEMQRVFPDIKAGDRLTGHHLQGKGASFWHNGQAVGQVADADFARQFFGIWLAPTTSQPAMRLTLLGLSEQAKP